MACCLTAPSHYLNQYRLIVSKFLWHPSEGITIRKSVETNQWHKLIITFLKSLSDHPGANELIWAADSRMGCTLPWTGFWRYEPDVKSRSQPYVRCWWSQATTCQSWAKIGRMLPASGWYWPRCLTLPGGCLNINMPSYQYRDSHVKDKTVSPTVLSLTWESPYQGKTVFILRALMLEGRDVYGFRPLLIYQNREYLWCKTWQRIDNSHMSGRLNVARSVYSIGIRFDRMLSLISQSMTNMWHG